MSNTPPLIVTSDADGHHRDPRPDTERRHSDQASPDPYTDVPPPSYGSIYGTIEDEQGGTKASVADDGRVNIRINQKTRGLSSLLVPALRSQLDLSRSHGPPEPHVPRTFIPQPGEKPPPPLNVVIHVVGSRGDVQPFVALGKVLKDRYKHRVRLATHPVFKDFVTENGLEFFDIAGDPSELMAFMVKNPGLMPGFDSLRRGDIGKRRKEIAKMIQRCWRSCIEAGDGSGPEASDNTVDEWAGADSGATNGNQAKPFVADAIIANPPSFAHIHCAEKLGIPLHMMFTMPWSPTQSFPHPLANITSSNADANMTNFMSYALVDMMTWQGLGDIINRFRQKSLNLEPVSLTWAPGMLARLRVPWTYCWSPTLIPKPRDWGSYISISGFYFLSLASGYTPDAELAAFLDDGPPPVYIGFGSIVVDDPNAMTKLIFDAVRKTGQRALVSKGWGGFGADRIGIPDGVFMLGNVPHDWLFQRVSCVVHHGGAGTTAAGIACGKPTVIVPFFGDQPFWGAMVARAGAGPKPVAYKELTADILAASIKEALKPQFVEKAKDMANSISHEKGTETGAQDFHRMLDVDKLRCALAPNRAAVWRIKRTEVRLSAFAATVLGNQGLLNFNDMKLYRPQEHDVEDEPWDPITGGASAIMGTMSSMAMGVTDMPIQTLKMLKIHPDSVQGPGPAGSVGREAGAPAISSGRRSSVQLSRFLTPHRRGSRDSSRSREPSRSPLQSPDSEGAMTPQSLNDAFGSSASPTTPRSPASTDRRLEHASTESSASMTGSKYDVESALLGRRSTSPAARTPRSQSAERRASSKEPFDMFSAMETGKGVFRMASAGIKSPMDFTLALARGFHNAPKLYGDESVRKSEKITDFQSGLRAAGKEFGYGMYDGITGLVTQPLAGAKKEGAAGFFKGVGRGIGGIVLKPGAAIWGIPGYTSKGIYKEMQKMFGPSVENYIIASRAAQGYAEVVESTPEEREAVVRRWKEMRPYIRKKKTLKEQKEKHKDQLFQKRQEIRKTLKEKYGVKVGGCDEDDDPNLVPLGHGIERVGTLDSDVFSLAGDDTVDLQPLANLAVDHARQTRERNVEAAHDDHDAAGQEQQEQQEHQAGDEAEEHISDPEFDEAIRRSVQESSHGDVDEDEMVQRAIRASVKELDSSQHGRPDDDELHRAIQASLEDARGKSRDRSGAGPSQVESVDEGDAHLERALTESKAAHEQSLEAEEAARKEEEVVMKYMMKQSLAEEEARRKRDGRS